MLSSIFNNTINHSDLFNGEETQRAIRKIDKIRQNNTYLGDVLRDSVNKYGWNIRISRLNEVEVPVYRIEQELNPINPITCVLFTDTKMTISINNNRYDFCITISYGDESYNSRENDFNKYKMILEKWGQEGKLSEMYIHPEVYADYLLFNCGGVTMMKIIEGLNFENQALNKKITAENERVLNRVNVCIETQTSLLGMKVVSALSEVEDRVSTAEERIVNLTSELKASMAARLVLESEVAVLHDTLLSIRESHADTVNRLESRVLMAEERIVNLATRFYNGNNNWEAEL